MNRRKVSTALKVVALVMMSISLIVNLVTLIGDSTTITSNAVVAVTLILGWLIYGIDKIFIDEEED